MTPILQLSGITKRFPGVLANDHIDLHLPEDEDSAPDQKLKDLLAGKDDHAD